MVLLRPLTGRLGMRRKSEWLGWWGGRHARAGWTGEGARLAPGCTVWGTISRMRGCSYGAAEAPDRQAGHAPQT